MFIIFFVIVQVNFKLFAFVIKKKNIYILYTFFILCPRGNVTFRNVSLIKYK